jgi:hypothetical protein
MSAGAMLQQMLRIVQDPTSNLTAAVLLLAILTLAVLIVIIGLLLAVTRQPASQRARKHGGVKRSADEYEYPELSTELAPRLPGEPVPAPRRRSAAWFAGKGGTWLVVLLAVLGVGSAYVVTSTDSFCREACHGDKPSMTDRARGAHKGVACVSCHEDPAPLGIGGALIDRAAHLAANALPSIRVYAGPVPSRRCLGCHSTITGRVIRTVGGARMSHREPLDAGMACRDCHGPVGHIPAAGSVGMAKCVRCHDSKTASADCRACHESDTGHASAAAGMSRGFPRVQLGPVMDCGGCHDQKSCDACHGIRLPHSRDFERWQHARQAAFGRKTTCYRCHTYSDCSACHGDFDTHGKDWNTLHTSVGQPGAKCACHWAKLPADARTSGSFCAVCH